MKSPNQSTEPTTGGPDGRWASARTKKQRCLMKNTSIVISELLKEWDDFKRRETGRKGKVRDADFIDFLNGYVQHRDKD